MLLDIDLNKYICEVVPIDHIPTTLNIRASIGVCLLQDSFSGLKVVLVQNKRWWEHPWGKINQWEAIEACLIREIREETGINNISHIYPIWIKNYLVNPDEYCLWFCVIIKEEPVGGQHNDEIQDCRSFLVWEISDDCLDKGDSELLYLSLDYYKEYTSQ